jgi:T5SS/PEP-CTERM-associated repeat protein
VNAGSTGIATVDGAGSNWTNTYFFRIGYAGDGTLNITSGGTVCSSIAYIGDEMGSAGTVTVAGAGSIWTNNAALDLGCDPDSSTGGNGTVNISSGGAVAIGGETSLGSSGGTGVINFNIGTLNTGGLLAGASELTGIGTINTHGLVSDANLVFDATHGPRQTIVLSSLPGQNITVNLDLSNPTNNMSLGAGYSASGSLRIAGGVAVISSNGYLGCLAGSTGLATVDGAGSTWTINQGLDVGQWGSGTLNINNGGTVTVSQNTMIDSQGGSGVINFKNGALNTLSLYASTSQLLGTGTINTHGSVTDCALVFDSQHATRQTILLNALPGQNIALNFDLSNPSNNGSLGAGYAGSGSLRIADGVTVASSNGYIGYLAGSMGVATVDGLGSTWAINGPVHVGYGGNGTLNITNGGNVSSWELSDVGSAGTGTVTVDGAGSAWVINNTWAVALTVHSGTLNITNGGTLNLNDGELVIGLDGPGVLNINSGGTVTSGLDFIGVIVSSKSPYPNSVVTVDGAGSEWNSGFLCVGVAQSPGNGTLNIRHGAMVSSTGAFIGTDGGAQAIATVDGAGSTWTISGSLSVGSATYGTLNISNGGSVICSGGYVGGWGTGAGAATVNVDGAGSSWTNNGTIYVGAERDNLPGEPPNGFAGILGAMNVTHGATVTSTDAYIGGSYAASIATVTVDGAGSTCTLSNSLNVGYHGKGILNITNGGHVSTPTASVASGSLVSIASGGSLVLTRSGGTNPHASVVGGLSSLSIASGATSGTLDLTDNGLVITGATAADESTLASYISGGQITSSVVTAANAAHPGAMTIAYDLASNIGLTFTGGVATWGGQTINQSSAGSDLLILPTLVGDLNLDGAVNFIDVTNLAPNLGKTTGQTWAGGDLSGDGAVNFIDITALAPNLGKSVANVTATQNMSTPAAITSAPEPASMLLLGVGGALLLGRRRNPRALGRCWL